MGVIALLGEDEVVKAPTKPAVVASRYLIQTASRGCCHTSGAPG